MALGGRQACCMGQLAHASLIRTCVAEVQHVLRDASGRRVGVGTLPHSIGPIRVHARSAFAAAGC